MTEPLWTMHGQGGTHRDPDLGDPDIPIPTIELELSALIDAVYNGKLQEAKEGVSALDIDDDAKRQVIELLDNLASEHHHERYEHRNYWDYHAVVDELSDDPDKAKNEKVLDSEDPDPFPEPWDVSLAPAMQSGIDALLRAAIRGDCTRVDAYCAVFYFIWDIATAANDPNLPTDVPKRYGRDVQELLRAAKHDTSLPGYRAFLTRDGVKRVRKMTPKHFVAAAERAKTVISGKNP